MVCKVFSPSTLQGRGLDAEHENEISDRSHDKKVMTRCLRTGAYN